VRRRAKLPKGRASEGCDFSEAPIFKLYGPSPTMLKSPYRWRNGATIPTREGQMKPQGAGRRGRAGNPDRFKKGFDPKRYTGKGTKRT